MASHVQSLCREDFQVAIICALPSEASAVIDQFDVELKIDWTTLELGSGDVNAYTYGVIGRHNVIVAHMPSMGKASAAGVATSIANSFPKIELALVVGICGGVPCSTSGGQIRLGDVIISEGIVEYDFRKQYPGRSVRKDTVLDTLSRPNPTIRSLLNKFKSDQSGKKLKIRISENLERLQKISSRYRYPGAETDQLFESHYRHKHHGFPSCSLCTRCVKKDDEVCAEALELSCVELMCDKSMTIPRHTSSNMTLTFRCYQPTIHYGLIASGDTVMKSGEDRDAIAKKDKVIAFEMEGAGVWEKLPCIVIKGVCDYADSHKNKEWQNFAAATGACCMKAFLEDWRPVERTGRLIIQHDNSKELSECLRSLSFPNIDARKASISLAHQDTCNWLFETLQFRKWQDGDDLPSHNGVLWIKGKPGAGKSTLMKHTLLYCEETLTDHMIAAYFFNARGSSLEKTPLGMMRSLLYQLLEQDKLFRERFLPIFIDKQKKLWGKWEWTVEELRDYLLIEMRRPYQRHKPLILLVDALDECNDSEVRDVVSFLESLSISALNNNTTLKICLSSRHYPSISMKVTTEVVVEWQTGHEQDIVKYVHNKLRIQNDDIEDKLLRKAQNVFMWVVLVVEMLNKAFDDGDVRAMRKKLDEVPSDLDEVFTIILNKDNQKIQETILMLQWVLFARRLLKPQELYFAVLAGREEEELGRWDRSIDSPEVIKRYITSTSRGLIEVRKSVHYFKNGPENEMGTVQFIHESVNDFLLRNKRLQTLDAQLLRYPIGSSHDHLAACCMSYIFMKELDPIAEDGFTTEGLALMKLDASDYPFLEYAVDIVLYHANRAHEEGHTQHSLVQKLQSLDRNFKRLRNFHDLSYNSYETKQYGNVDMLYVVALEGYCGLAEIILSKKVTDVDAQRGHYGNALQAASVRGKLEIVELLLEKGAAVNAQGGRYGNALQAASVRGKLEIVELLLEKGAAVNAQGGYYGNALQAASVCGKLDIVELLLEKGAAVNAQGGEYGNALHAASYSGELGIVELLLEKGAAVNAHGGEYGNALQAASVGGKLEIVELLLEKGATVDAQGGYYGNALQAASVYRKLEIVELLLEKGAAVNAQGGHYGNALQAASWDGKLDIVELLLEKGAIVNAQGGCYGNALQAASCDGKLEIVELLLEKGAAVNAQGGPYGNALHAASYSGELGIVELLLEKGAAVNAHGGEYGNALQAASWAGKLEIVELLLEKGAAVNAQGGRCGNALHAASVGGKLGIVELLLEKGADVNA